MDIHRMEIGRPYSKLLQRLEMLKPLRPEDRQLIAELPMTVVSLASREQVNRSALHDELAPARCTLVLSGFLAAHQTIGPEQRQITSFFVPGDIADLHSLYLAGIDHGLTAVGTSVVAFVPHAALHAAMDKSPQLAGAFWRQSLVQAVTFREWLTNLGRREAIARVAHLVCELAVRLRAVDVARDWSFSIPWTQSDIADACGISSVHANRVVQKLRRLGLLDWSGRKIAIRDWSGLAALGGFSDDYLVVSSIDKEDRTNARVDTAHHQASLHVRV
jgi:CRP-like cAMP-binding protein